MHTNATIVRRNDRGRAGARLLAGAAFLRGAGGTALKASASPNNSSSGPYGVLIL